MAVDFHSLPVYEQKGRILDALKSNQVIVAQSPTGSGKTTQIPVILYEAGYAETGAIAVTQPRRIAALSVSEFISRQLGTTYPGLVGYKMRFEDKTDATTKIKIMTDGILLQEMKLDPWMSKYSVIMVDEAHERSLNIDFTLGLIKRILAERKDFRVVVSSATMNAEAFSSYFDCCPIVTIDTTTYPVSTIYDPPAIPVGASIDEASDALLSKIEDDVEKALEEKDGGAILIFLPGEKSIKDCMFRLGSGRFARRLHILPLYGRLQKEEQERVFEDAPPGKRKVVIATNIAETSVTISGVTTVIDSGLAKLNFYNPRTFTSSLNETPVSKASCDQRRGRAGRTCPGVCYRLYTRDDFESRQMYTTEEIYRTDLSEVVMRMAELGITDFYGFDFISPPGHGGIAGAVETLVMLKALSADNTLSSIGRLMIRFPLEPRVSRIIVEAIMRCPDVIEESIVAASFLSANSPFSLPPGEEMEARKAHHSFRDPRGDFVSYLRIFRSYSAAQNKERFCKNSYLDSRVMAEIANINAQLSAIVGDMQIPITGGGSADDYLRCVAAGMIQFVCARDGKENYRTLTADRIRIHPGSSMFRENPQYIVAGEIARTSRMFAMSVSPLSKALLDSIDGALAEKLGAIKKKKDDERKNDAPVSGRKDPNSITLGGVSFPIKKIKGKKRALLDRDSLKSASLEALTPRQLRDLASLRGKVVYKDGRTILDDEKLDTIALAAMSLNLSPLKEGGFDRKMSADVSQKNAGEKIARMAGSVMRVATLKQKGGDYGFVSLMADGRGRYWLKVVRSFIEALNESLSSLETLIDDDNAALTESERRSVGGRYRVLSSLYT